MDRTIKLSILAILLALVPLSIALAGPPALQGKHAPVTVVEAAVNSAPKAVFPQTKFEFAPVFEGEDITHDFVVENRGQAPLIINKIKPD
jgi:hypothetical protein